MKRFLKVIALLALTAYFTSCKQDDGNAPAPPRDYKIQYGVEKIAIEEYLRNHYISSVGADYNVVFAPIEEGNPNGRISIWDQTNFPLQNVTVKSNGVDYVIYYLRINQGAGEMPTRADNVMVAYTGYLTDDPATVFQSVQFPDAFSSLSTAIEGWQEIIPLFNTGIYNNSSPQDPASFSDYGAGVMFLPSGLAYYNSPPAQSGIGAYETIIFNFRLLDLEYTDMDLDGILNKDEKSPDPAITDIADYDSDGDGKPNYLDTDDDNDGYLTKTEIGYTTGTPVDYNTIQDCNGQTTGTKKHLDPACH